MKKTAAAAVPGEEQEMAKRKEIMNRPEHKAVRITERFWKAQMDKIHQIMWYIKREGPLQKI